MMGYGTFISTTRLQIDANGSLEKLSVLTVDAITCYQCSNERTLTNQTCVDPFTLNNAVPCKDSMCFKRKSVSDTGEFRVRLLLLKTAFHRHHNLFLLLFHMHRLCRPFGQLAILIHFCRCSASHTCYNPNTCPF